MNRQWDKRWIGILIGLAIPFVGYAIFLMILEQLAAIDSLQEERLNFDFKHRTTALLALALNLIPMRYFRRNRATQALWGIVVATMLYAVLWMVGFGRELL